MKMSITDTRNISFTIKLNIMHIVKHLILALISLSLLTACEDKKKNSEVVESNQKSEVAQNSMKDNSLTNIITEIDELTETPSQVAYSMSFSNDIEDIQIEVLFVGDTPAKINERFSYAAYNTYGIRSYYLQENKLIASKEVKEEMGSDSSYFMRETRIQYENGQPILSQTRVATYEEELDGYTFKPVEPAFHDFERVMAMLNNTGEFVMSFTDIIETPNATYLLLKTQGSPALSSAVMLEYRDSFTDLLLSNKKKYKGKKVDLEIEMATRDGMTYQAYRSGRFLE
jgi:hypothetical protein